MKPLSIRFASMDDVPSIVDMGRRFVSVAGFDDLVGYDEQSTTNTVTNLISSDFGAVIVAEDNGNLVGMVAGMLYPYYFNTDHITGQEMFW